MRNRIIREVFVQCTNEIARTVTSFVTSEISGRSEVKTQKWVGDACWAVRFSKTYFSSRSVNCSRSRVNERVLTSNYKRQTLPNAQLPRRPAGVVITDKDVCQVFIIVRTEKKNSDSDWHPKSVRQHSFSWIGTLGLGTSIPSLAHQTVPGRLDPIINFSVITLFNRPPTTDHTIRWKLSSQICR